MADDQNKDVLTIDHFLTLFKNQSESKLVFDYFEANGVPFVDDNNLPMNSNDFFKEYCCDLQWAKDAGFCKTQSTGNTGGSTGKTGQQQNQQQNQQQTTTVTQQQQVETKPAPPFLRGGKQTVAAFQDWLDINYPGWAKGYPGGMMNRGKGYGEFNDVTEEQYNFRNYERLFKFLKSTTPKPQRNPDQIRWDRTITIED
jgi:hypothetical protein